MPEWFQGPLYNRSGHYSAKGSYAQNIIAKPIESSKQDEEVC